MKRYRISWTTDYESMRRIMAFFGMKGLTVNKRTDCYIKDEHLELFFEGEKKGYYYIQNK